MALTRRISSTSRLVCTPSTADWSIFSCELIEERPGFAVLEVRGRGALAAFKTEGGGHRWQRVPPSEKRGRRHTSTITVAVMPIAETAVETLREKDIEWRADLGSGAGGQARNKTSNAVRMTHLPTGVSVRVETSRSQWENRQTAARLLTTRLAEEESKKAGAKQAASRKQQVGSGQRGDKIRTIRLQDDTVTDHRSGKSMPAKKYLRGEIAQIAKA